MFLYLLLSLALAIDSHYLGSIKYSLTESQTFEHQFFDVRAIKSLDLYFPDPPYRKVTDEDMKCYWALEQIGMKEVSSTNATDLDSYDSDYICFDECYLRQGNVLITQDNALELEQSNYKLLPYQDDGILIFYNEKSIQAYDTITKKVSEFKHLTSLKQAKIARIHDGYFYICSENGLHIYNHQYQLIAQLYHEPYYSPQGQNMQCKYIMLSGDYLFAVSDKLDIFDINDPMNIQLLFQQDVSADLFDIQKDLIGMVRFEADMIQIHVFQFNVTIGNTEQLNITLVSQGIIENEFGTQDIEFKILNKDIVTLTHQESIILVQIKTSLHSKIRHNSTLLSSQHYLQPNNKIHIYNGSILQVHDGKLHKFNPSSQTYNLVCAAPKQNHIFYGLIRSDEACKQLSNEKFAPIIAKETEQSSCIYTFQMTLYIQVSKSWTDAEIILVICFIIMIILIIIQWARMNSRNSIMNNLQKFEQLNKMNQPKEKIRITYDDDENPKQFRDFL